MFAGALSVNKNLVESAHKRTSPINRTHNLLKKALYLCVPCFVMPSVTFQPEQEVLINKWNLSDNTQFNTDQMTTLGEALAAQKTVSFIYILQ